MTTTGFEILMMDPGSIDKFLEAEANLNILVSGMSAETLAYAESQGEGETRSRLLTMNDDIALIQIKGSLTHRYSFWNRYSGIVSYTEIREAITQAIEAQAGAIVFDYDTPGGYVNGMSDTASLIDSLKMPTIAFTAGSLGSAGYFLASQSDYIYADTLATVGSIGVFQKVYDRSAMLKEAGIKVHRFRSGPLKATGDPDFALTREEKAYLTEKTTYMANTFYNIVSDARGLPLAAMEKLGITSGRTFIGEQAKAAMLIDEVKTFDQSILKAYDLAKKYLDKSVNRGIGYRH